MFAYQPPAGSVVLGKLTSAALNSTADQALSIPNATKYVIRRIVATNASGTPVLAAGGLYAAASKTTLLTTTGQVFTALTAAAKFVDVTAAALLGTDVRTEATLYLSLSVANSAAVTADIYVIGDKLE